MGTPYPFGTKRDRPPLPSLSRSRPLKIYMDITIGVVSRGKRLRVCRCAFSQDSTFDKVRSSSHSLRMSRFPGIPYMREDDRRGKGELHDVLPSDATADGVDGYQRSRPNERVTVYFRNVFRKPALVACRCCFAAKLEKHGPVPTYWSVRHPSCNQCHVLVPTRSGI